MKWLKERAGESDMCFSWDMVLLFQHGVLRQVKTIEKEGETLVVTFKQES